jgi:AcrR family transcriptional regulator
MVLKNKPDARKYHHGDLRRAVMDAALAMASESGIESISLREVARRIGVTTGAPYHHFPDRQSLLLDLAIEAYARLLAALKRARENAPNPHEELKATAIAYLRFGRKHRAEYAIMFAGEYTTHPRVSEMLGVANQSLDLVRSSIAAMRGLGEKSSAEAAFCAWSLLHGILQLDVKGVLYESAAEQEKLAVHGVISIVNGFVPDKPLKREKHPYQ